MADQITASSQYGRAVTLTVFNGYAVKTQGMDLSQFRIKFSIKRNDTTTPNTADIRIYNVLPSMAETIAREFTTVTLQAGYMGGAKDGETPLGNFGLIFRGDIKQIIAGRENATDTFIDIVAGDGERSYNYSVTNASLGPGSKPADQLNQIIIATTPLGITEGTIQTLPVTQLPRTKVMYGPAKDYIEELARSTFTSSSIQNGQLNLVQKNKYLPGEAVVLTSLTGMIGTPEQTNSGVNVKCLINPKIIPGGLVQIDNASIQKLKINLSVVLKAENIPVGLNADGFYYVLTIEHSGDTRGNEYYSSLVCLKLNPGSNPLNNNLSQDG